MPAPEFEDFFYSAQDGLRLHARIYGDENRGKLPVVCLPGLTRNAADFHELALQLTREAIPRRVIAFDYRGRGRSQYDRDWRRYDIMVETADLLAGLTTLDIEHAAFIGTSRGGLIIHVLAAMRPGALKAVVLNDVGPVIEGAGLAQIRTYLERAPKPSNWEDAVAIQRMAAGDTFPALEDDDWERMTRAIFREDKKGRIVPDYDRRLLQTVKAVDFSKPLPEAWPQFIGLRKIPSMVIRGENSKLLSAETVSRMKEVHRKLETVTVAGQGHAPLLETGDLPGRIARFISFAEG